MGSFFPFLSVSIYFIFVYGLLFPSVEEFSTVCCDLHKGFSVVGEAEVDVFLEFPCFFDDPLHVGNLKYGFSKFR